MKGSTLPDDIVSRSENLVSALESINFPQDARIVATIRTADMLLGHDNFCMTYLKAVRAGLIKS